METQEPSESQVYVVRRKSTGSYFGESAYRYVDFSGARFYRKKQAAASSIRSRATAHHESARPGFLDDHEVLAFLLTPQVPA